MIPLGSFYYLDLKDIFPVILSLIVTVASYDTYSYYIHLRIRDKLGYHLVHNRMSKMVLDS